MVLVQLNDALTNTVILFMLVCGFWGLFSAFRGGLSGSLAGALVLGEGLVVVHGLLGTLAYLLGYYRAYQGLHILYSVSAVLTFPGIYSYTRTRSPESQALWFGGGALFIVGLVIRNVTMERAG